MNQTPGSEPGNPDPPFDLAEFMRGFEKQMSALREQAKGVQPLIDATSTRVESEGGELAVTVALGGGLVDVEFLPASEGVDPAELGALVMQTHERAVAHVAERSNEIIQRMFDDRSKAMDLADKLIAEARRKRGADGAPRE